MAVIPKFKGAQIETASQSAREIRNAVTRYRARGTDQCPTVTQLVSEKEIDSASKVDDPWGTGFRIECGEDEVWVMSNGPDKKEGTADDISVPKKTRRTLASCNRARIFRSRSCAGAPRGGRRTRSYSDRAHGDDRGHRLRDDAASSGLGRRSPTRACAARRA